VSRNIKYTKSFVKDFFNKNGCELLNENYKSIYEEKIKFKCKCGNISKIMFYNFKRSLSCKECGWKRTSVKLSNFKYNEDFFEKINTGEKAYWLGFILADGCVEKRLKGKRYFYRLSVEIKESDLGHLEKIANIFGVKVRKRRRKKIGKYLGYVSSCSFALSNKKIVEDLIAKGVVPRKTYEDCSDVINSVENEFISDFIRGYFDGDGTVCISKKNGIEDFSTSCFSIVSHRKEILEKVKKIMVERLFISNKEIMTRVKGRNNPIFLLCWGGRFQLYSIYNYLYKGATVFLDRKKKIFDRIYEYNSRQNKKKSSIYNGVYYFKPCKRWAVCIVVDKKQIHLGYYDEEKEAAMAYDKFIINNVDNLRYKLNILKK
jgi:hypothetical protein